MDPMPSAERPVKVNEITQDVLNDEDWLRRLVAERGYQYHEHDFESSLPPGSHQYVWDTVIRELEKHLPHGRVLDAGCGNGSFCGMLSRLGRYEVSGMDLSKTGIEIAKKCHPGLTFKLASVSEDIESVFDHSFDAIVSLEVIEHLYDPRGFIEALYQGLRPGGVLVISTTYHGYWKNLLLSLTGKMDAHFTALWDGGRVKFFSRRTLTKLLAGKGFKVLDFVGCGRLPHLWKSMVITARRPER